MPEPFSILAGLGLSALLGEAAKEAGKAAAGKIGGLVGKKAYDSIASRYAAGGLPPGDPLAIAVAKAQVTVLLAFVKECQESLNGLDSAQTRAEREFLDRKHHELTSAHTNAEHGAAAGSIQANDLSAILSDDGDLNRQLIASTISDLAREQSPDAASCYAGRIRNQFQARFVAAFRAEAAKSEPLDRMIRQAYDAAHLAVSEAHLEVSQQQLDIAQQTVSHAEHHTEQLGRLIQAVEAQHPPTLSNSGQINTLPPPPADFTGRTTELANIAQHIEQARVIIAGLRGLGGVGKTALALVVAHQLAPRYPDAAIYINLLGASDSPLDTRDAQASIIRAFHPQAQLPDNAAELSALYNATLHDQSGLLLLDNAHGPAQIRPLLPPEKWALLVTSRQRFTVPGLFPVDLVELAADDARTLLQSIAPRLTASEADAIARLCGRLPLALRLAGGTLQNRPALSAADYIRRLGDEERRISLLDASLQLDPDQPGVEASLQISFDILPPVLQASWPTLAVFPASFDAQAAAAVWNRLPDDGSASPERFQAAVDAATDVLDALVQRSLLEADQTGRYRLHDLARLFANRHLAPPERDSAARCHAQHFCIVLWSVSRLYLQGGDALAAGLSHADTEWPNILAGHTWISAHTATDPVSANLAHRYPNVGAAILSLRLHPREYIQWLELALSAARVTGNRLSEATTLGNLGNCYDSLGELRRAIEVYEQALVIHREIGDRSGEASDFSSLGNCHAGLGDPRRAIELYEQALVFDRETGDRRGQAVSLGNLGNRWAELGEPHRAIDFHEQALAINREIGDWRGVAADLGNLGNRYAELGEPRRAIELHEQALAIRREVGDRRGEAHDLGNLGLRYAEIGELRLSIEVNVQALQIRRTIGDRHGEARDLNNLGNRWAELSNLRRAIDFHEQSLAIYREIGDRRGEATILGNLATRLAQIGDPRRAIDLLEQLLPIRRETGDRHGEGADLTNLANCYSAIGEPDRAVELCEQALSIRREIGDRRGEATSLFCLAIAQVGQGNPHAALQTAEESRRIRAEIEDPYADISFALVERLKLHLGQAGAPPQDGPPA